MGCSSFGGGGQPSDEVLELERRVIELQRRSTVAEQELARLRTRLDRLEGVTPASATPAPSATRPAAAEPEREVPPEPAEPVPPPVERTSSRVEASDLEPVAPATPIGTAGPEPVTDAAQQSYDQAYTLYHEGRYEEAEASFSAFLRDHPSTELSDNAQYWVGASRFARGDYQAALVAFRRTVERHPEGNKVPDALFKIGQSLEQLGESAEARDVYLQLAARYPETAAAALAAERAEALGGE